MRSRFQARVAVAALSLLAVTAPPPAAHAAADQNYTVELQNYSSQGFDEAVLAVTRFSNPVPEIMSRANVPPFTVVSFDLGPCADVHKYALSGIVGGERVFTTGDVDADHAGCNDVVTVGDAGAVRRAG
ncbi:hypothetical protein HII36_08005 [Nonomuraea sp. NN258]|uniref:hypothetical protein n=1 Tax=Nonomuraea antri TaxID=2730852 RepID=UPI00156A61D0|nr:hypothetical protein [Nonomuraea antri]NRQ31782.1 hypothetical protein [Nonomuraea antri]